MIDRIKNKIHALVFWQTPLGDLLNKLYSLNLFYKYSFNKKNETKSKQLEYYLRKQFHIIEKGLALPSPRPGFGKQVINNLINISVNYQKEFGTTDVIKSIVSCLDEYLIFNSQEGEDLSDNYYQNIYSFVKNNKQNNEGGTKSITKEEIRNAINFDYKSFITTRASVRDFALSDVPEKLIKEAVNIAKFAPSVCNRQPWKAHLYSDPITIKALLELQNGNRGFTNNINKLIIVAGDYRGFTRLESNQIYIDGGIFASNIMLALHAKGLGSIGLNTCVPFTIEKKIKRISKLKPYENLIVMIGIGSLKDNYKVAVSKRKNISLVYEKH